MSKTIGQLPTTPGLSLTDWIETEAAGGSYKGSLDALRTFLLNNMPSLPKGKVAWSEASGTQGSITNTEVDVTGVTVTWSASAERRYKITFGFEISSTVAADVYIVKLTDNTNVSIVRATESFNVGGVAQSGLMVATFTGLSGAITRKLRVVRSSGSGTISLNGTSDSKKAFILVEDIGLA